jgi:transcriptional regulator with XRE-family HTH domain
MATTGNTDKTIHQGRNIKRFREILGIKQDALAVDLGLSQQAISQLEQKEALDADMLEKIAAILKVPVEAIKNFDAEQAIHNINNTFHDNSVQNQFNPIEKIIELYEVKIVSLYERLLQTEKEKIELLEGMIKK